MAENFANDYTTELEGGIAAGATTLSVPVGAGATSPDAPFRIKIGGEIILVGSKVDDTFNDLTRGEEGTAAAAHADGDPVEHVLTAETLTRFETALGVVGAGCKAYFVGTQASTAGVEVAINLSDEDWDTHGFHSNTTNISRMTIPAGMGGVYQLRAFAYTGLSGQKAMRFRVNGSPLVRGSDFAVTGVSIMNVAQVALGAGDNVDALFRNGVTGPFGHATAVEAMTTFEINLIRPT